MARRSESGGGEVGVGDERERSSSRRSEPREGEVVETEENAQSFPGYTFVISRTTRLSELQNVVNFELKRPGGDAICRLGFSGPVARCDQPHPGEPVGITIFT